MDKYTKFILTVIAVGILGLNYYLFSGGIISPAHASSDVQKVALCDENGRYCADVESTFDETYRTVKALAVKLSR